MKFRPLIILFILGLVSFAKGQDYYNILNFRAVDLTSNAPVQVAHIINKTHKDATIADMLGYFKIRFEVGDTLSISSLGYYSATIFNWGQYTKDSLYYTIKLKPRHYEIKELKFVWYSTYEKFLIGFKNLDLPKTKDEMAAERINLYFKKSISKLNLLDLPKPTAGFSFGKDWLAKQNEKFLEKLEEERTRRLIERKYSAGIVEALTGLKGNEVFWFMEYCAFTNEYLLKTSDYDIRIKILEKFKIYNQDKTAKENK